MGQGFFSLLLQDPQQTALLPQATALLLVVLEVLPIDVLDGVAEVAELLTELADAGLVLAEIQGGQIAAKAALHQLFGLGELVALQQV